MPSDGGFMTPSFGVIGIALSLIAIASLRLAQTEEAASRRDLERMQELYRAEGAATIAAWRILHMEGHPASGWNESTHGQTLTVWVEPEARKLGLAEIAGAKGQQRLISILGSAEASRLTALFAEQGRGAPSRLQLRQASADRLWARCGLSLVSTHSRLTDSGLTTSESTEADFAPRAGEVWRVVVSAEKRLLIDRLIRFTGRDARPVAILDQLSGGAPADASCIEVFKLGEAA
jgi:hypothetical protein